MDTRLGMDKLKPCPFCGSEAEYVNLRHGQIIVRCKNIDCLCGTKPYANPYWEADTDREKAAKAWNRRASDGRPDKQTDEG